MGIRTRRGLKRVLLKVNSLGNPAGIERLVLSEDRSGNCPDCVYDHSTTATIVATVHAVVLDPRFRDFSKCTGRFVDSGENAPLE